MRTTIDKAGRVVIPQQVRRQLGLVGGGEVDIGIDGTAIRIEPVVGSVLVQEEGLLVIRGSAGTRIDDGVVRELLDADRFRR